MVRLQQHFPKETEEEWRRALHGKVRDDVILVSHGFPLPVLLFHVLLQVETRLLGDIVLFEESLRKKNEVEAVVIKQWMKGSDLTGVLVHLKWGRKARQCVRGPVMRCKVHNGLEDVFAPRSVDGIRACEKIYTYRCQVRGC